MRRGSPGILKGAGAVCFPEAFDTFNGATFGNGGAEKARQFASALSEAADRNARQS